MLKNVVFWGYTGYQWLTVPLAAAIKQKHRARIHFICTNEQSVEYWKQQDLHGVIDSFTTIGHFFSAYDQCGEHWDTISVRARELECTYGLYVVDALQADRHLGRGFFAGGTGHPRSLLSERADYWKSVNFFNTVADFWERFFDDMQPDLVIGLSASVIGEICTAVARRRGVPVRVLFLVGYQSYHGWATDQYYSIPIIRKNFAAMKDCGKRVTREELTTMRRLPVSDAYYRDILHYESVWFLLGKAAQRCRRWFSKRRRGIVTVRNYLLRDDLRSLIALRSDLKKLQALDVFSPSQLHEQPYVFFALHVEPESSVGMQSPEFNEQLGLIELVAKNLPAGIHLVVKEHIAAIGRRPREFYATILDIPNVIMVSPFAYALEFARSARAVITITGTIGGEAAMCGIPVVSFGLHNNYNIIPHVHTVESWTELRPLLAGLCDSDVEDERKKREEDGMRYLAAVKKSCFDFSWSDYASKQRAPASPREVDVCYRSLLSSLGMTSSVDAANGVAIPCATV